MLTVNPVGVQSGESICPNTTVVFTCVADQVAVVIWTRNGTNIVTFTSRDLPPIQRDSDPLVAFLKNSTAVSTGIINFTSTLEAVSILDLQNGESIGCKDRTEISIVLNYTIVGKWLTCQGELQSY